MKTLKWLYCVITCVVFSFHAICQDKKVVIIGKVEKFQRPLIRVHLNNYVLQKDTVLAEARIKSDSSFRIEIQCDAPHFARLSNSIVFLTPGDSVQVIYNGDRGVIYAEGINAGNYIFFSGLATAFVTPIVDINGYESDWTKFKTDVYENNKMQQAALLKFKDRYTVSDDFIKYASAEIKYRNLEVLLLPVLTRRIYQADSIKSYVSELSPKKDFADTTLFVSNAYMRVLFSYFSIIADTYKDRSLKKGNLVRAFSRANALFNGKEREALFLLVLRPYAMSNTDDYKSALDSLYSVADNMIHNIEFKQELRKIHAYSHIARLPLPEIVLDAKIMDINDKVLRFVDLLNDYNDSLLYIDFWASWCGPCIMEMKAVKQKNNEDSGVVYLYFSKDKGFEDWKSAIRRFKLTGNHYWMQGDRNAILDFFRVQSIPRYILVKNRFLRVWNAPRPSESEKLREILGTINGK